MLSSVGGEFMNTFPSCFVSSSTMMFKLHEADVPEEDCANEEAMFIDLSRYVFPRLRNFPDVYHTVYVRTSAVMLPNVRSNIHEERCAYLGAVNGVALDTYRPCLL